MSLFDDFDTSGIAGTTMQDALSFDVAHWLLRRIPRNRISRNPEIAWNDYWEDYPSERARAQSGRASFPFSKKMPMSKPTSRGSAGSIPPVAARTRSPGSSSASSNSRSLPGSVPSSTIRSVFPSDGDSKT